MGTIQMSVDDDWINRMWYIHTMEHYSAIMKNETVLSVATWMDLGTVILSRKEKDKCHMMSLMCGI